MSIPDFANEQELLLSLAGWTHCEKPPASDFPGTFSGQTCWTEEKDSRVQRVFVGNYGYALEVDHAGACAPSILRFPRIGDETTFRPAFERLTKFMETGEFRPNAAIEKREASSG